MNVLMLTPQFPWPTHQGTTLRNYNLIKGLAQNHEVHLFSILAPGDRPDSGPVRDLTASVTTAPQVLRSAGHRLLTLATSLEPDMAWRLWSPDIARQLAMLVSDLRPDILQIEGIEMAPYFFALRQMGVSYGLAIYDAHNAETLLQWRAAQADVRRPRRWAAALYSAIQSAKLRRYERQLLQTVDGVAAVSDPDARFLRSLASDVPIEVVTNGVDLSFYQVDDPGPPIFDTPGPHLVFTGKMDFRPNVDAALWFAAEVMPKLRAQGLTVHFWVVGRNPHQRLSALADRDDVTVTGEVPDVRPYIVQADVYVVPLLAGGGTRFKILEALALAKPVVSTSLGADGIPVQDDVHLALADDPETFAGKIIRLLGERSIAEEMGRRGRLFIQQDFSWDTIVPRLENLYQSSTVNVAKRFAKPPGVVEN